MRTRIKFCGLRRQEDVDAAVAAGADALGFVLWAASPRAVTAVDVGALHCQPPVPRVGVLVNLLEHHSNTFGGAEDWNVRNRNNQVVASGVYFYHIEAGNARKVGRFTIVNFAQ